MGNPYEIFSMWVLWGREFLPDDVAPFPDDVRKWAAEHDLLYDPEAQLITPERAEAVGKLFTAEDQLGILMWFYVGESGKLEYLEYVYLPVATLIKKGNEVRLVWWQMVPTMRDDAGRILKYGEVRFGFWLPESWEEFCSMAFGKLVVKKFENLLHQTGDGLVKELASGIRDVTVDGSIGARFFKTGRYFDVEFSLAKL